MTSDTVLPPPEIPSQTSTVPRVRVAPPEAVVFLCAIGLIGGADWLFWGHQAGISLVVFAALLAAAFVVVSRVGLDRRRMARAFGLLAVAVLPVIEMVQGLSVMFLVLGLIVFTFMATGRLMPGLGLNARRVVAFPFKGIGWFVEDIEASIVHVVPMLRTRHGILSAWGMPIVLGLVFLALFAAANPVIEGWTDKIFEIDLAIDEPWRILFWVGVMVGAWPFLRIAARIWPTAGPGEVPLAEPVPRGTAFISDASVTNALVLFNVMFAIQTLLDALYLWGGVDLPDGMTYATYAHRGAYPLVVTAILAGAFVIIATSRLRPGQFMRGLIYLWVGQNVLLLVSSVLRLELYVSVYSLTHLRIAAFIWMGLLVVGFGLIIARMVFEKGNPWLVTWNGASAGVVLYVCCFVNFADVIARYNISHSFPVFRDGRLLDNAYICGLGPHALPAVLDNGLFKGTPPCAKNSYEGLPVLVYRAPETWRGWGFRDWRLERYLATRRQAQMLGWSYGSDGG